MIIFLNAKILVISHSNSYIMKLTKTGYRITKNGSVLTSIEKEAIKQTEYKGNMIKENSTYYFFNRKQGNVFIYLP